MISQSLESLLPYFKYQSRSGRLAHSSPSAAPKDDTAENDDDKAEIESDKQIQLEVQRDVYLVRCFMIFGLSMLS